MVGDAGVGKSSLITAAATESFPEHPPPVLPPTRLAHDSTPEGVPMVLVDTSSRPEDKGNLELACRNADVIILCFDSGAQSCMPTCTRQVSGYIGAVTGSGRHDSDRPHFSWKLMSSPPARLCTEKTGETSSTS